MTEHGASRRPLTSGLSRLEQLTTSCTRCPGLRSYCAEVGRTKRRAFQDFDYWARPVPGFGDPAARLLIVGLAPGAHGANRTGRMFTGDRSGDFLYAALHRAGIANQPDSIDRDDGLQVSGAWIGAACRCAPPANKPTASQLKACLSYLVEEIQELAPRVVLALGGIAWTASLRALHAAGHEIPRPRPRFGHAVECDLGTLTLVGSYHVSQLNTFTGRLTPDMFDAVLHRVQELAAQGA